MPDMEVIQQKIAELQQGIDDLSSIIAGDGTEMEDPMAEPPADDEMQAPETEESGSSAGLSALDQFHRKGARRQM